MPENILKDFDFASDIIIDTNIFLYYYDKNNTSIESSDFIENCIINGDISCYTTVRILDELFHRMLLDEARNYLVDNNIYSGNGIYNYLQRHPEYLQALSDSHSQVNDIISSFDVYSINKEIVEDAIALSKSHMLFSADSLTAAIMLKHNIKNIATNDGDFDNFANSFNINIWKPSDI